MPAASGPRSTAGATVGKTSTTWRSSPAEPVDDLLALDAALGRLATEDPAKAELVKLRYFAGLSIQEAAAALGISVATAKRRWAYARVWLFREVEGADPTTPS